jgi:hypothetical protein
MRTIRITLLTQHIRFEPVTNEMILGVVYATTSGDQDLITLAIEQLLRCIDEPTKPRVLWQLQYQQRSGAPSSSGGVDGEKFIALPASSVNLAFDENILDSVKAAWQKITGGEPQDFLVFEDRNPVGDDDDDE